MMEEMSFRVSFENCQGFSILDGGGKLIPGTVNETMAVNYGVHINVYIL